MTPERANFRPLDNSSTTRLSYDLEMNHYMRAFNSAQRATATIGSSFGFVGMLISLVLMLIIWVFAIVINILSWLWNYISNTDTPNKVKEGEFNPNKYPHTPNYLGAPDEKYFNSWG